MSAVVRLTRSAEEDLLSIAAHIAADHPSAARRLIERFDRAFQLHATQPLAAAVYAPRPQYRHIAVGNYVAFYEPQDEGIIVARVLHGARNLPDLLGL